MNLTPQDAILPSIFVGIVIAGAKYILYRVDNNNKITFDEISKLSQQITENGKTYSEKIDKIFQLIGEYNKELYEKFVTKREMERYDDHNQKHHQEIKESLDNFKNNVLNKIHSRKDKSADSGG